MVVAAMAGIGQGMVVVVIKVSMVVVMELGWCRYHWGRATKEFMRWWWNNSSSGGGGF